MIAKTLLLLCLLTTVAAAGDRLYWGSVVFMVGGHTIDAVSSYGMYEGNPLMRSSNGRQGVRGIPIVAGVMGEALLAQRLCGKRSRKAFTKVNFAVGGFRTAVAARTIRMRWGGGVYGSMATE